MVSCVGVCVYIQVEGHSEITQESPNSGHKGVKRLLEVCAFGATRRGRPVRRQGARQIDKGLPETLLGGGIRALGEPVVGHLFQEVLKSIKVTVSWRWL